MSDNKKNLSSTKDLKRVLGFWDLMVKLEKELPMAFVFYGQDTLLEHNEHFDELGIFLPNSVFLNNLKRHITKAEAILYEEER